MSSDYSKFTELMSYFHFVFNVYYVLIIILMINTSRTVLSYFKRENKSKLTNMQDLITSALIGFALANALFFHGVLSDISEVESNKWLGKILAICLTYVIVFMIELLFRILSLKKLNKNETNKSAN